MKKKVLAAFLAGAMVFSLAACGSSSGGSSSTSESSSSNSDYEHLQAHEGSGIDWSKYNTGDGGFNFR